MPEWRAEILRRLGPARLRPEREADIALELAQHLEHRYRSLIVSGHPAAEAERLTWRELEEADVLGRRIAQVETVAPSNLTSAEATRASVVAGLWQDLRYAARRLRQRPLLTATVIVTVALTLGPTTAVLGMADALFVQPMPGVARQDRLVNILFGTAREQSVSPWFISYANAAEISQGATTVDAMAGWQRLTAGLAIDGAPARYAQGAAVSANYFDLLGVSMVAGRTFADTEDRAPGGDPVVILGEALARGFFATSEAALGKTVLVNALPFTVVGVAPRAFAGPRSGDALVFWITGMASGRANHTPPARWTYPPNRGPFYSYVLRMAPGATVDQTMAELSARTHAIAERDPQQNGMFQTVGPILQPGFAAAASLRPTALRAMRLIGGVAALLVLLGMANVANLLIFRGLASGRDMAIRKALGARSGRLIQLRLCESLMLAFAGAAVGVGLAFALRGLMNDFVIPAIGSLDVTLSWRVIGATVALAVLVGVGFGLAPAILAARETVTAALGRGGLRTELPRASRLRHALAAAQIALSLSLLVGALLFLTTLRNLHAVDLGFDPAGITMANVSLRGFGYTAPRALEYERQLAETIRRQPGVQAVAVAYSPPMFGVSFVGRVYRPGGDPKQAIEVPLNTVSTDYFRTLALPIVRGRAFSDEEAFGRATDSSMPIVISETLARQLFGSIDAVGRSLLETTFEGTPTELTIVGVTREAHFAGVDSPPDAVVYEPLGRSTLPLTSAFVLVRSDLGSARAAQVMTDAASAIDPTVPLAPDRTFDTVLDQRLGQQRLFAWILGLLGTIGFVLAAVGLHGLVAQTVTERRREFGIRVAIGADRPAIVRLVVGRAATVTIVGLSAGLMLAWLGGQVVESQLFGVTSHDPWPYAAAVVVMSGVVTLASVTPTRAATRVNAVDVLRSE